MSIGGAQYGEDAILAPYFADTPKGFLVDVGAANGVDNSNSIRLLERGWSGILIEPEPDQFAELQAQWRDRADIECLNIACGTKRGLAPFYRAGQVSTLDTVWRDRCIEVHKLTYRESQVVVEPLEAVLSACLPASGFESCAPSDQGKFAFLSVDCEGRDRDVLESLDLTFYRPRLIVVEGSGSYLASQGYHQIKGTHGNRFWERDA